MAEEVRKEEQIMGDTQVPGQHSPVQRRVVGRFGRACSPKTKWSFATCPPTGPIMIPGERSLPYDFLVLLQVHVSPVAKLGDSRVTVMSGLI